MSKEIREQINRIRNFNKKLFEQNSSNQFQILDINEDDKDAILEICAEVFQDVMDYDATIGYLDAVTDWSISKKAVLGDKIIGCYLFNEQPVTQFVGAQVKGENLKKYSNLKGIQGVALALLPEYRNSGYGKQLREVTKSLGYDYIWGQHLKGLHNVDNWLRYGRRLVADTRHLYITLMDLKLNESSEKKNFDKFHQYQELGHTCGPTCIKMVTDFFGLDNSDIDNIIDLCGCNTKTGTIDVGMKNALDNLQIDNLQNPFMGNEAESMEMLDDVLDGGNLFIMRTLTRGVKHWIIVYDKNGDEYMVADPWLGLITYDSDEILSIWSPRDFDGFIVYV